jgi:hypothetical protein
MAPTLTLLGLVLHALRPLSPAITPGLGLLVALKMAASAAEAPAALLTLAASLVPERAHAARGAVASLTLASLVAQLCQVLHTAASWLPPGRTLHEALSEHAAALGLPEVAGRALVPPDKLGLTGEAAREALGVALGEAIEGLVGLVPQGPPLRLAERATERPAAPGGAS